MAEFPFPITIRPTSSDGVPQTIVCVGLLRGLAGKRKVFDATWDQQPVVVKVFADRIKAKYRMKREWRGLKVLQERGLNSPAALFCGRAEQYGWVVVTEKIVDASTVREVWDNTTDTAKRRELLHRVGRELGEQHTKGVLQKDLHLGNLLLQGEKLFALDPSQMHFHCGEVDKRRAIAQLALLVSSVPDEETTTIASVCEKYAQVRSWEFSRSDMAGFWKELARCRKDGIRKGLRKCLRTNKRHQKIKQYGHRGVAARDFFEEANFGELLKSIDEVMRKGQILKDGNTCFVSRISGAGKEIVVKRYNHKGIIHSVRQTIKRSRARRAWVHGHRLAVLNIATPRPLAYFEQCKWMCVWKSYLITEYVGGKKLYDFLRDSSAAKKERSKVTQQVKEVLDKLGTYRITHGDLKHTNILITENGLVLTDLDAMQTHKWNWIYRLRRAEDLRRLAKI